jgi:uncharacterized glyoxalase superfamily protein PhnB
MTTHDIGLWHSLTLRDADSMFAWLRAVGFVEHATYRDEADPSVVQHSEWTWSGGGGVTGGLMVGSARDAQPGGNGSAYLVCTDPTAVMAAALAAGGTEVVAIEDKGYGGTGGTVADPEGNHWSLGTYRPS